MSERAVLVSEVSEPLGDLLKRSPEARELLAGELEPWDPKAVEEFAAGTIGAAGDPALGLVRAQRLGLLRVAARDLLGMADTATAAAELADLAEGILRAALAVVRDEPRGSQGGHSPPLVDDPGFRLTILGMGKLGGRELNYVSDVDVLFVHDGDLALATRAAERVLRLVGAVTPEGRAYEIDANLRPEGKDGPLTRSLEAYAAYYERWAKTWEYQALLKARPVAGDEELGRRFIDLVTPYVWPDRLEADAVDEIQRMKAVVEGSKPVRRAGHRELKLGPGGLRDIEFAVQLLQLVHGRHDPSLRSPNTLAALAALAEGGYVDEGDAALFGDAYQFLRTVEHRVQLRKLRRSHVVPADPNERYRLARACGFRDIRAATALEQFDREYARVQAATRRLHEQLFYRPLLARFAELSADEQLPLARGADGQAKLDADAARERLAALGFADPVRALGHLEALASGVTRGAKLMRTVLPAMLPVLADAPDPDEGLAAFRSLAERLAASPFFLRTLRDAPPVGEILARVLGHSRVVGEWLQRQPEVIGQLADLPALDAAITAEDEHRLVEGLLRRGTDLDETADGLRRLKRREVTRIAIRDLTGRADALDVAAELSALAEASLHAGVTLATADSDVRLAVIGLGKLGGRELSYASDLDILLVFAPDDAHEAASRAAERLVQLLSGITPEGSAFQVDLNLRPEGKDGPLARSLSSYAAYYERWAEPWEFQALTQARPVAGDPELGAAFVDLVTPLVYPASPPEERLAAVRRMKARVERERAGRPRAGVRKGDRLDVKLGAGGLADIEWTVQLLQLRHGGAHQGLRVPGALPAIDAAEAAGVLDERGAEWLRLGWRFLTRVRNASYLAGARDSARLPLGGRDAERLARMLGYPRPGGQALVEDLGRVMRRVRKVHERRFYAV